MKTLLVPGWMKSVEFYGHFEGLDIWKRDFSLADYRSVDCVIAHSMGASYALAEELIGNQNTRYYLINPMLVKKSFFSWIIRWTKFAVKGGVRADSNMEIKHIFSALKKAIRVARYDIIKVLDRIPKESVTIIRGKNDNFFCDQETLAVVRKYGFQIVEVDKAGHEWDDKFNYVLNRLIK